jgi:hypothetical protein
MSYFEPQSWAIQSNLSEPSYATPKTIKCPECFKPLGQDDAYGHDCEVE